MAHFQIEISVDGRIQGILRDGEPHAASVVLEQLFSIVTLYFTAAEMNIQLLENEKEKLKRRAYGVQSFLMSLTGLEAFTNTYFKLRGEELCDQKVIDRVSQRYGSLTKKIRELLSMTPEGQIEGQDIILDRLHELSQLRNALVHPQWEPASAMLAGNMSLAISGLVQNFQATFEDFAFCHEALMWCLLLIARVGRSRGNSDVTAFIYRWAGIGNLGEREIMNYLGVA